jgi:hypothetical protein
MSATAKKTNPELWNSVKEDVTRGSKGGRAGQWSARKAQLASQEYQKRGGGYEGGQSSDNHLKAWTKQEWSTKSGEKSSETGERYLPKKARETISDSDYARSTANKRRDIRRGKQHSLQPKDVAQKTVATQTSTLSDLTKAQLMAQAAKQQIRGRSRMKKEELINALKKAGKQ